MLQVEDPLNAKDIKLFSININPVNDAPIIKSLPIILLDEDETFLDSIYIWEKYVVDIDNPFHTLDWELISSNKWVKYNLINNNISVSPEKDWFGNDTIIVAVSDGEFIDSTSVIVSIASMQLFK